MKNKQRRELAVCGFAAVKALEKKHPESITRFYYSSEHTKDFGSLCRYLALRKVPYNQVENSELEKLCDSVHHQGVVAMIEMPKIQRVTNDVITEWMHNKEIVVLLDRVGNANNLGAIARSAAFFGIKNIIIPHDEAQTSVTTSTYRIAQGAIEDVKIYSVDSIFAFLSSMKDKMIRFGTDVKGKIPVSKMSSLCKKPVEKGAIIVLGNEENGISNQVKKCSDYLVTIPTKQKLDTFDSLNVAQAASIIFYAISQQ